MKCFIYSSNASKEPQPDWRASTGIAVPTQQEMYEAWCRRDRTPQRAFERVAPERHLNNLYGAAQRNIEQTKRMIECAEGAD
jgi:hypothetical protein